MSKISDFTGFTTKTFTLCNMNHKIVITQGRDTKFKGSKLEIYQVFISLFFLFFVSSCLCG